MPDEMRGHRAGGGPHAPSRFSGSIAARLWPLARPYRPSLSLAVILMLGSTAGSLALPLLARDALDRALQAHRPDVIDRLVLGGFGLIVLTAVASFGELLAMAYAGNGIIRDLRMRMFSHLQRLPVGYFDLVRPGDLASRLSNDVSLLQNVLVDDVLQFVGNVARVAGGLSLALVIDWRLTVAVAATIVIMLAAQLLVTRRLRLLSAEVLEALSGAIATMIEALGHNRSVKAFGREAHEDARAGRELARVFQVSLRTCACEAAMSGVARLGLVGVLLGIAWYGGRGALGGRMSPGSLLAFLMTIALTVGPMGSLSRLYSRLQRAAGAAGRLFEVLDRAPEAADPPGAVAFPPGPARVEFDGVEFAYAGRGPVLRGLSLELPAGGVTALVGPSGAGKTTLALLLYRFYEPQAGEIRVNGRPVKQIALRGLRERIGLVPQEPALFHGTLRENLRYGRLEADDAEVEAAARAANVAEFAERLPQGYDTVIGERGITLSAGQRQRVAIGRAILKNPRILILDEATSALDAESEALVREAIERSMRGRTTLVIAHRLTTIQGADRIAVLDRGCVVESGTHDELIRAGGRYSVLHGLATAH